MRASAALLLLLLPSLARAQLACGNANVETRTIRYCRGGPDSVAVVFESGLDGSASIWDSVAARLSPSFRVITWDRPGHGGSPATPTSRMPANIATDLSRLLDQVGERDPVVLVGHAEGSWFARASRSPRFSERGIQRVVHHLERNGPGVIAKDGSMLADWLSAHGDERQTLLLEFTAHHLAPGSELERALDARPVSVDWGLIHEDLRKLSGGGRETLSFEFLVHVMSFRKRS